MPIVNKTGRGEAYFKVGNWRREWVLRGRITPTYLGSYLLVAKLATLHVTTSRWRSPSTIITEPMRKQDTSNETGGGRQRNEAKRRLPRFTPSDHRALGNYRKQLNLIASWANKSVKMRPRGQTSVDARIDKLLDFLTCKGLRVQKQATEGHAHIGALGCNRGKRGSIRQAGRQAG